MKVMAKTAMYSAVKIIQYESNVVLCFAAVKSRAADHWLGRTVP